MFTNQNNQQANVNLNAPGGNYANNYGHQTTKLLLNDIMKNIIDLTPDDYIDQKLLMLKKPEEVPGDEHIWMTYPIQRQPLRSVVLTGNIAAGVTQAVPVLDTTVVGIGTKVNHPTTNKPATVISINPTTGYVTLQAMSGQTLDALSSGSAYIWANTSDNIADGDGTNRSSYRLNNIQEEYNYIQLLYNQTGYDLVERKKLENLGTTDYIAQNKKNLITRMMQNCSNEFWNGTRAEGNVNGRLAKFTEGLYPWMIRNSVYQSSTTPANIYETLIAAHFATRHGSGNYDRMIWGTPKWIQAFADELKLPYIRYTAQGDTSVSVELRYIDTGTGKLILNPYQRFENKSGAFPGFFENLVFLTDWDMITPLTMRGLSGMTGKVGDITSNDYTTALSSIEWMFRTVGNKIVNPNAHALITVTP